MIDQKYRNDFPFFKHTHVAYLDSAATAQKPQQMIDALIRCYTHDYAPVHRGLYRLAEQLTEEYESVRMKTAHWINARLGSEIIFTAGTTASINLIASSWARHNLNAGDEIVLTELEHHANMTPWQRLAQEKGLVLRWIPVSQDGNLEYANLDRYITAKTKLVAITHCSNALGAVVDVARIADYAHRYGARILIDAAQTAPHQRLSVDKLHADFLAFSPHKMGGPTGMGVLYIKGDLHDQLQPYQVGGSAVYDVTKDYYTMRSMPQMLEPGTPPIAQVIAFGALLDYLSSVDFNALKKYEAQLCAQLIKGLQSFKNVAILGPIDQLMHEGHLVSFVVNNIHAHDVAGFLDTKNICVRAGHHCAQPIHQRLNIAASIRASFYLYTTQEEVERLLEALGECL